MSNAKNSASVPEATACGTGSPSTRLIVLTFDHLSADCGSLANLQRSKVAVAETCATEGDAFPEPGSVSAFDLLDLQSAFFEQHYSQDLRDGQLLLISLGASGEFQHLRQLLQISGLRFRFLRIAAGECCDSFSDPEILPRVQPVALNTWPTQSDSLAATLMSCADAHFLWIHVQNGQHELSTGSADAAPAAPEEALTEEERLLAAERVLRDVLQYQQRISDSSRQPVRLLVTALRGTSRRVSAPFESLFTEDLAHVPLWIDRGRCESSRIASISGSLDVVTAIVELLSDNPANPGRLLALCESSAESHTVTLPIQANGCEAVRTSNLLIVRQQLSDAVDPGSKPAAESQASEESNSSRIRFALYLKPEDVWNVHDQSEVYQEILEDYVVRWPELHPVTSETS